MRLPPKIMPEVPKKRKEKEEEILFRTVKSMLYPSSSWVVMDPADTPETPQKPGNALDKIDKTDKKKPGFCGETETPTDKTDKTDKNLNRHARRFLAQHRHQFEPDEIPTIEMIFEELPPGEPVEFEPYPEKRKTYVQELLKGE